MYKPQVDLIVLQTPIFIYPNLNLFTLRTSSFLINLTQPLSLLDERTLSILIFSIQQIST